MKAHLPTSLTNTQKKAMDAEIRKQLAEYDRRDAEEIDAMVLWVLYSEFGFGEKRLRRFFDKFTSELKALTDRYVMEDCDTVWLCTRKLKDAGIDISEWLAESEQASQNTNFKS